MGSIRINYLGIVSMRRLVGSTQLYVSNLAQLNVHKCVQYEIRSAVIVHLEMIVREEFHSDRGELHLNNPFKNYLGLLAWLGVECNFYP